MRQLENRAASLPKLITETQQKRVDAETTITEVDAETTITEVDARIDDPFKHSTDLREAQERQARVLSGLAAMASEQNPRAETPGADGAATARDRVNELAARARAKAAEDHAEVDPAPSVGRISQRSQV